MSDKDTPKKQHITNKMSNIETPQKTNTDN